jgi:hypothetical protein
MNTLSQFARSLQLIPAATGWYLADLGEAIGKQQLFTKQSPQKLRVLREHALIESAVSSNRIEGVEVDRKRIGTLWFGRPGLRDRDEEEVRGYRDALNLIHRKGAGLAVPQPPSVHPQGGIQGVRAAGGPDGRTEGGESGACPRHRPSSGG